MKLTNYIDEICAIAKNYNVELDVGLHMFVNNIEDAGNPADMYFYHGADYVDYAALKVEYDKLTPVQVRDMVNEARDYIFDNMHNL